MQVTHIVLHYTATYPDAKPEVTAAVVDDWHKKRGFRKIGYHYLYRRDGTEEVGRAETEAGAHVGGQNQGKIGLSFAGGLERATGPDKGVNNMTPAQEKAIIARIKILKKKWPKAIVCGHKDLAATQCPGFDVATWWAKVNKQKAPEGPEQAPELEAPVTTPNVREDVYHVVESGDTFWSISQAYGLTVSELERVSGVSSTSTLRVGQQLTVKGTPVEDAVPINPQGPRVTAPSASGWASIGAIIAAAVAGLLAYFGG